MATTATSPVAPETVLAGTFVVAPRATRVAAATLTAVSVADSLQYGHLALQKAAD